MAKKSKQIRHTEDDLQASLVQFFRLAVPQTRAIIFAIPNGGYRKALEAIRLIEQGATAGIPDLQIVMPDGRVCWVEVKRPKNALLGQSAGTLSKNQKDIHLRLKALAHQVEVIDSIYQFQDLLKSLGLIRP
jgi:hypothetical protein